MASIRPRAGALGDLPIGGPARRIYVDGLQTCALLESDELRCWGYNEQGQLGYGNLESLGDDPGELPAPPVDLGGPFADLAVDDHSCAIMVGGAIRCWGNGTTVNLGQGNFESIGDMPGEMPPPVVPVF